MKDITGYSFFTVTKVQYGLKSEAEGVQALQDFFRQEGVPKAIIRDNSKMQTGKDWSKIMREYGCKDKFIEPHNPQQSPCERDGIRTHKNLLEKMLILTGCDKRAWFKLTKYIEDIRNRTAKSMLYWRTPLEIRDGETPDISAYTIIKFWEKVYYLDPRKQAGKAPKSTERGHNW